MDSERARGFVGGGGGCGIFDSFVGLGGGVLVEAGASTAGT